MTHAEIIARATAEAERQGFTLVAIHAVPAMGAAITLCLAPGYHPWAVHRFSIVRDALNHGGYTERLFLFRQTGPGPRPVPFLKPTGEPRAVAQAPWPVVPGPRCARKQRRPPAVFRRRLPRPVVPGPWSLVRLSWSLLHFATIAPRGPGISGRPPK